MICKACGLPGCTWKRAGEGWRLLEPNGERHRCTAYRRPKPKREPAHEAGPRIIGRNYRAENPCASCTATPWESCACYPSITEEINHGADERLQRALELAEQG